MDFNPRSPCGERHRYLKNEYEQLAFQSTLPLRGTTPISKKRIRAVGISIHAPLAGNDQSVTGLTLTPGISIHAPLAGNDRCARPARTWTTYFNPRSPCGERPATRVSPNPSLSFQSTLPLRGTTALLSRRILLHNISIHAPLAGNDKVRKYTYAMDAISIHAPLAGNDLAYRGDTRRSANFNPRSPCGERLLASQWRAHSLLFQSTLPLRGTTETSKLTAQNLIFQSTLPLRGTTYMFGYRACQNFYFNPRSPCGERPVQRLSGPVGHGISIHAPLAGNDTWWR